MRQLLGLELLKKAECQPRKIKGSSRKHNKNVAKHRAGDSGLHDVCRQHTTCTTCAPVLRTCKPSIPPVPRCGPSNKFGFNLIEAPRFFTAGCKRKRKFENGATQTGTKSGRVETPQPRQSAPQFLFLRLRQVLRSTQHDCLDCC